MTQSKWYARAGLAAALVLSVTGCAVMYNSGYETKYFKKNIYVSQVEQVSTSQLQIHYKVLNETIWSSPGVNYTVRDDALYITPVRCYDRHKCSPQARNTSAVPDEVVVTVPYNVGVAYMVFEDGETRLNLLNK